MFTNYMAWSQTVIKEVLQGVRTKGHACCVERNYVSLTCVSQHRDKWQKCTLSHSESAHYTNVLVFECNAAVIQMIRD